MLEERSNIDSINVTDAGHIEVRRVDRIVKDGVEVARTYHRHTLAPGADLSSQDARVVAVAKAAWTPDVIAAHKAANPSVGAANV